MIDEDKTETVKTATLATTEADEDDDESSSTPKSKRNDHGSFSNKLDMQDLPLIAKMEVSQYRPKHTGRFLTMHKRRRKRLVTRSLAQDPGLLDDVTHGQVQVCIISIIYTYRLTLRRSYQVLSVH